VGVFDESNDVDDLGGEGAVGGEAGVKGLELCFPREGAVKEEVANLFEVGVLGEIVNGVAAVEEDALLTVDEAGFGCVEDYVLETPGKAWLHSVVLPSVPH
jgi:hypothetical protein